jgi:UDP-N-acetylmuramoyl-L-alanyl-D-glutamate--2,6-diaminopimelate ligase
MMSKKLYQLLEGFEYEIRSFGAYVHRDIPDLIIPAVASDERKLSEGCLFICCRITNHNGAGSMVQAARAGAAVIITEPGLYDEALASSEEAKSELTGSKAPVILFAEDTRYAMAFIWAAWYDHPV